LLNTVSTMTSECFFVRSETRETSSTSSALVMLPLVITATPPEVGGRRLEVREKRSKRTLFFPDLQPQTSDLYPHRFRKWSPRVVVPSPTPSLYSSQSARNSSDFRARIERPIFRSDGASLMIFIG